MEISEELVKALDQGEYLEAPAVATVRDHVAWIQISAVIPIFDPGSKKRVDPFGLEDPEIKYVIRRCEMNKINYKAYRNGSDISSGDSDIYKSVFLKSIQDVNLYIAGLGIGTIVRRKYNKAKYPR